MFAMKTVDWRASLRSSRLAGAKPQIALSEGERRSSLRGASGCADAFPCNQRRGDSQITC